MGRNKKWVQIGIFTIVLIIGVFTIITNLSASDSKKYPQQGDKATNFSLVGLDGQTHELSDYKGKPVLMNFWGTFCPPCKEEMPDLQKMYDKWKSQGVVFLEVNVDKNKVTVQGFMDQYKLNMPVLLDANEVVRKQYGVMDYPTTFFIGPDGKIVTKKIGQMDEAFIDETLSKLSKS
ncbi:thiol-disulfide oxidoreductase ResA [Paenibacillus roseipurpureus]|uniref:Thiol-disulfide oxidoreductase ResA n=1 Tax=Paenibacillus roseopurpureus TaxID=2918901 RepID=A0AA96RIQ0_9BACL|nr:thiol-disulfide oxidoreductase ResA [Paenibacillus sp. MBLB1832]WNR42484.1 thiol-disulfide oxidoreductase ResA [Paenibacillus sp. MBLB1832]